MDETILALEQQAKAIRRDVITETYYGGGGHPGGSLSCVDILTALYFHEMHIDPQNPSLASRDRLILSKAHAASALYATLCRKGFFDASVLPTFGHDGSILQRHPDRLKVPGLDASTGSLGQGLSLGCGMALAARMDQADYHVYVIVGDGELDEGSNWEAAMTAAHYKLSNLTLIVDRNQLQIDGTTEEIMHLEPLADKLRAFGMNVMTMDGNNMEEVVATLQKARAFKDGPTAIIANTIKGKGVSFMEKQLGWHSGGVTLEQAKQAYADIGMSEEE